MRKLEILHISEPFCRYTHPRSACTTLCAHLNVGQQIHRWHPATINDNHICLHIQIRHTNQTGANVNALVFQSALIQIPARGLHVVLTLHILRRNPRCCPALSLVLETAIIFVTDDEMLIFACVEESKKCPATISSVEDKAGPLRESTRRSRMASPVMRILTTTSSTSSRRASASSNGIWPCAIWTAALPRFGLPYPSPSRPTRQRQQASRQRGSDRERQHSFPAA